MIWSAELQTNIYDPRKDGLTEGVTERVNSFAHWTPILQFCKIVVKRRQLLNFTFSFNYELMLRCSVSINKAWITRLTRLSIWYLTNASSSNLSIFIKYIHLWVNYSKLKMVLKRPKKRPVNKSNVSFSLSKLLLACSYRGLRFSFCFNFFVLLFDFCVTLVDALVKFLCTILLTFYLFVSEWLVFELAFLKARK